MKKNNCYRVLHIFSSFGGGISSLVINLIENKKENFKFDIMTFSYKNGEKFLERAKAMGCITYQMPRPRIEGYYKFKNYVDEVIADGKYDAVHCHITGWHAKPFINSAKESGIRTFIFHAHTTKYDSRIDRIPIIQRYNRYLNYTYSTAFMTCSDLASEYIYGKKYLVKREAHLIPNGINETHFSEKFKLEEKINYKKEFNIPDGTLVVGFVGRFSAPKNLYFVLEIIKNLKNRKFNSIFLLVGDGEMFEEIRRKATQENLLSYIRFTGRRDDIPTLMNFFDVMILPSFNEGLPTVAIECQAAGTKIILADTITKLCDMKLGLTKFLSIKSAENWADEIKKIQEKQDLDNKECISQIIDLGFSAKKSGERYCNLLSKIIKNDRKLN